jgi:hypothetical protein
VPAWEPEQRPELQDDYADGEALFQDEADDLQSSDGSSQYSAGLGKWDDCQWEYGNDIDDDWDNVMQAVGVSDPWAAGYLHE